jgi:hypothetical protein
MESPVAPASTTGANTIIPGGDELIDNTTGAERQAPSVEAIAACDEFVLDELWDIFGLIISYSNSALEACRRGDRLEIRLRLRQQLRDCFRHAVAVHDLLSPAENEGGQR